MKERLKNDLLLLINQYLDSDTLRIIDVEQLEEQFKGNVKL